MSFFTSKAQKEQVFSQHVHFYGHVFTAFSKSEYLEMLHEDELSILVIKLHGRHAQNQATQHHLKCFLFHIKYHFLVEN